MSKRFDVIGIESPCLDFPLNMNSLPKSNGGARLNNYSWQGGGKVSTGMIAAARLGAKCCQIGAVGDDIFGMACYKDFVRHGVDVSHMYIREGKTTPLSVVMSDLETMGRSIVFAAGNCGRVSDDEIPEDLLRDSKYYFTAFLSDQSLRAAKIAKEAGAEVLIDADGYSETTIQNMGLIDYFIASEFFYKKLWQDTDYEAHCREMKALGPKVAMFTLGEKGCVGIDENDEFFQYPAYNVPVVDTVGCGDVYHGAFLAGLLQGWGGKRVAQFASAVSAIKATRIGGRAGIPNMETVLKFMETGEIDPTELDQRELEYRRGLELKV